MKADDTTEIERKFLVNVEKLDLSDTQGYVIEQGYLKNDPEITVRVRTMTGEIEGIYQALGKIDIKGASYGPLRKEVPAQITHAHAHMLLYTFPLEGSRVSKMRHPIQVGKHTFEVDVFYGDNAGLVMAEVELDDANEEFERPEWLGVEVTDDPWYLNCNLAKNPYKNWTPPRRRPTFPNETELALKYPWNEVDGSFPNTMVAETEKERPLRDEDRKYLIRAGLEWLLSHPEDARCLQELVPSETNILHLDLVKHSYDSLWSHLCELGGWPVDAQLCIRHSLAAYKVGWVEYQKYMASPSRCYNVPLL